MRITPVFQLTFAVISMTVSLVFIAISLGLFPNEINAAMISRRAMAENLALQLATLVAHNDIASIDDTVQAVVSRGHDVLSAGLRKPDGTIVAGSKDHDATWARSLAEGSENLRIEVPLQSGDTVEGKIELLFSPLAQSSFIGGVSNSTIGFISFLCGAGVLGYYLVLKRSLRELDPGGAFPDRVTSAFNILPGGVLILDQNFRIILVNDAFQSKIYDQPEPLIGSNINALPWVLAGDIRGRTGTPWESAATLRRPVLGVYTGFRKKSGQTSRLIVNASPIMMGDGSIAGLMVSFDDVTSLHQKNEELHQANFELRRSQERIVEQNDQLRVLASTDSLTRCYNRRTFMIEAEAARSRAIAGPSLMALLMIDVDHFKKINDHYGHPAGDVTLTNLGSCLRGICEGYGFVGRLGGEEFCIVLEGITEQGAGEMAEYIRQQVALAPNWLPDGKQVTCSIGYCIPQARETSLSDALKRADEALYAAKTQGRNRVVAWDDRLRMCA